MIQEVVLDLQVSSVSNNTPARPDLNLNNLQPGKDDHNQNAEVRHIYSVYTTQQAPQRPKGFDMSLIDNRLEKNSADYISCLVYENHICARLGQSIPQGMAKAATLAAHCRRRYQDHSYKFKVGPIQEYNLSEDEADEHLQGPELYLRMNVDSSLLGSA